MEDGRGLPSCGKCFRGLYRAHEVSRDATEGNQDNEGEVKIFVSFVCFYELLIGVLSLEALETIVTHDYRRLLWGSVVVVLVWGVAILLNFVIFPPVFRLLGRLTGKQGKKDS